MTTSVAAPGLRRTGLALVVYTLVSVALTWPVALTATTTMIRSPFAWTHLGWMDLVRRQLLASPPHFDVYTTELGFPAGGFLVLINWTANLLYLPLGALLPPILAFNLLVTVELVLAGWAMWRLGRRLGMSEEAAMVAGVLFAASPYALSIVFIGENPNLCHGLLPLMLWAMVAIDEDRAWWLVPPTAALLVLINATTPYYGIFTAALLAIFGPVRVLSARGRRLGTLVRYSLVALLAAVMMVPVIRYFQLLELPWLQYILIRPAAAEGAILKGSPTLFDLHHATLTSFFLPGKAQVAGEAIPVLHVTYLGWIGLLLGGVAVTLRRDWQALGWAALLVGAMVFMLGDRLYLGVEPWMPRGKALLLPLGLLKRHLHFLQNVQVAYRCAIVATTCLAIVAGLGLTWLLARAREGLRAPLAAGVGLLALTETLVASPTPWPMRTQSAPSPTLYLEMGRDPEDYAVLPFPYECRPHQDIGRYQVYFYYKTLHGKKVPYTERLRVDRRAETLQGQPQIVDQPLYHDLCALLDGGAPPPARDLEWFERFGVRWLVVHEEFMSEQARSASRAYMAQYDLPSRCWEDEGICAWQLTGGSIPPVAHPQVEWLSSYLVDWRVWKRVDRSTQPMPRLWGAGEAPLGPPMQGAQPPVPVLEE